MSAVVVLGMHRSGTSAVAGMIAASGAASAGQAVRNWDNARGHHEMLELVRLDEAVLAHSGGHYLSPPAEVRWTDAHAAERDRLLSMQVDGRPALLKDPRMLLVLPFWRASAIPFRAIGVLRHPMAVARSLSAWREVPIQEGIFLWMAHLRVLAADRAKHGYRVIDFERPRDEIIEAVAEFTGVDPPVIAAAYDANLIHHDADDADGVPTEAVELYSELAHRQPARSTVAFPRAELAAFMEALEDPPAALVHARRAIAAIADPSAVLVPVITALLRVRALSEARTLLDEVSVEPALAELLRGKVALAAHDPSAVAHLAAACAVPEPYFQARNLLPHALRVAGRHAEARAALEDLVGDALYPHGPLSTLAEWAWRDGDHDRALADLAAAIAVAPIHRHGRLRTRRAEWLIERGDREAAREELERAIAEDPAYPRSRVVLATLTGSR